MPNQPKSVPLIIGVCGKKSHGKNAVANILYTHYGYQRIAFADHVKQVCMSTWGFLYNQLEDAALKEQVDPRWGFSPRQAMQMVGTGMGRKMHPDTWVRKVMDTIKTAQMGHPVQVPGIDGTLITKHSPDKKTPYNHWCVSDVRYPNEAEAIRAERGRVIKVVRSGMPDTDTFESEMSVDGVDGDDLIQNDGSLEDLTNAVTSLVNSWKPLPVQRVTREPVVNRVMLVTGVSYAQAQQAVSQSGNDYERAVNYLRTNMRMR